MSGFHGFPPELFTFFEGLEKDNSKAYHCYLRLQASGLMTGCGALVMAPDQFQRLCTAIDDDTSGRRFEELITQLAARSLPVTSGAEPLLKASPPANPKTHPRAEFCVGR